MFLCQPMECTFSNANWCFETKKNIFFHKRFVDSIYSVGYNDSISWKSELLNGPQLYPAIGVDLSRIGDNIPDTEVLVTDKSGKQWTKAQLLA